MQELDVGKRLEKLFTDTFLYGWTDQTEREISGISSSPEPEFKEQVEAYLLDRAEHRRSDKTSLLLSLVLFSRFGQDSFWLSNFARKHLSEKLHLKDFRILHLHIFENVIPLPDRLVFNITERIILDIESAYHSIVEDFKSVPLRNADKTVLYLILHNCRIDLDTQNKEMICLIISHIRNVPIPPELVESMEVFLKKTFYARISERDRNDAAQKEMKQIFFLERPVKEEEPRSVQIPIEKSERTDEPSEKSVESPVRDDRALLGKTLGGRHSVPEPADIEATRPAAAPPEIPAERPVRISPTIAESVEPHPARDAGPELVLERKPAETPSETEVPVDRPEFDFSRENRRIESSPDVGAAESLLPLDSLYSVRTERESEIKPPDFSRENNPDASAYNAQTYQPSRREPGVKTDTDAGDGKKVRLMYADRKNDDEEGIHLGDIFDGIARFFGRKSGEEERSSENDRSDGPPDDDTTGEMTGGVRAVKEAAGFAPFVSSALKHVRKIMALVKKRRRTILIVLAIVVLTFLLFFFLNKNASSNLGGTATGNIAMSEKISSDAPDGGPTEGVHQSEPTGQAPELEKRTISADGTLEIPRESAIIQSDGSDAAAGGVGVKSSDGLTITAEPGGFVWTVVPDDFIYRLYVKLQDSKADLPKDIRNLSDLPWEDFFVEFKRLNPDYGNYSLIYPGQKFHLKSRD